MLCTPNLDPSWNTSFREVRNVRRRYEICEKGGRWRFWDGICIKRREKRQWHICPRNWKGRVLDSLQLWFLNYLTGKNFEQTYLLTPWSRVIIEKLIGSQLVKKFPAFYGTRRFITAFTSARHLSLSRASSIFSTPSQPTSWRTILMDPPIYA